MRGWLRVAPAIAVLAWGGNHFSPLLLLYRRDEHYSPVAVDLLFAVYILGIVPGFLVAGPLSDRLGRRRTMLAGVALGCIGSAVLAAGASSLPLLAAGRLVSGLSVAVAMVVGSTWVKELSAPPFDVAPVPVAARRAALTLTAGFGLGPAVSGALAQWGPVPTVLPYLVQIALTLLAAPLLLRAPETRVPPARAATPRAPIPRGAGGILHDLGVPPESRRRFLAVVAPAAPWVFGSAGLAFAVTPALVARETGALGIAYATLLAIVTLAAGALVQPSAPAIGRATGGRQLVVGLSLAVAGTLVVAAVAATGFLVLGLLSALLLGAAYGVIIVSGLTEVQASTPPARLAGATAVYYSITYVGFVFPVLLAALEPVVPAPVLLVALAGIGVVCLLLVRRGSGRAAAAWHPRNGGMRS